MGGERATPLRTDEVHLWLISFDDLGGQAQALGAVLAAGEQRRAAAFRFDADRRRFVLQRGQLRVLLESYTGRAAADMELAYGAHGRPRLPVEPGRPDVRFSVARSRTAAAFAFALHRDVGVDLEPVVSPDDVLGRPEGYGRMLSPAERLLVEESPASRRAGQVLRLWVRKEACLKAVGCGLSVPPAEVDVSTPLAAFVPRPSTGGAAPIRIEDFTADGHLGAVAVVGAGRLRVVRCPTT